MIAPSGTGVTQGDECRKWSEHGAELNHTMAFDSLLRKNYTEFRNPLITGKDMLRKFWFPTAFLFSSLVSATATADVLLIDNINKQPPNSPAGVLRPTRSMSMEDVLSNFGEPLSMYPPVGDPPITRWKYPAFTVYFEYRHVINAVVNRPDPATE